MTGDVWLEKLNITREWIHRRNHALSQRAAPSPVDPEFAGLYLEFSSWCRNRRVLDLGCGSGRLRHFQSHYFGLDALPDWYGGGFPFTQGLAEVLPFPDATFDGVLSIEAFDHFRDPAQAAAEVIRVLRPCGRLLIFVCRGVPQDAAEAAAHLHYFDSPTLSDLFRKGFSEMVLAEGERYLLLSGKDRR